MCCTGCTLIYKHRLTHLEDTSATSKNEKSTTESVVEMHIQALTDQRREREDALAQVRAHFATLGTKIDALDAQRDALGAERDQLIVRLVDSGIPKKVVAEISGLSRTKIYMALRAHEKSDKADQPKQSD